MPSFFPSKRKCTICSSKKEAAWALEPATSG
jgi:hypothetical protein